MTNQLPKDSRKPAYFANSFINQGFQQNSFRYDSQFLSNSSFNNKKFSHRPLFDGEPDQVSQDEKTIIHQQINHLTVFIKLQNLFNIVQQNYKSSFYLLRDLFRLEPNNYSLKLQTMIKILNNKANFQKKKFFSSIKDQQNKKYSNWMKGFTMMEIALNRKFINQKVSFLALLQDHHDKKQQQGFENNENNSKKRINEYLFEIVKFQMFITMTHLEKYKRFLVSEAFQQLKIFLELKRFESKKRIIQQKYLRKLSALIKIDEFRMRSEIKSKIKAFRILSIKPSDHRQTAPPSQSLIKDRSNNQFSQLENPQLSIYVSSIKSMIKSLNNFEQKAKLKTLVEERKSSLEIMVSLIKNKSRSLVGSCFYSLLDLVDYQFQRDKLQVLEREVMTLREDIEDV